MTERTQTRDSAFRWGMLMWFDQLLLEKGTITEAEFRQMRLEIEKRTGERRHQVKLFGVVLFLQMSIDIKKN